MRLRYLNTQGADRNAPMKKQNIRCVDAYGFMIIFKHVMLTK